MYENDKCREVCENFLENLKAVQLKLESAKGDESVKNSLRAFEELFNKAKEELILQFEFMNSIMRTLIAVEEVKPTDSIPEELLSELKEMIFEVKMAIDSK